MAHPEKKIAVIAPTWLGDAAMSLPLVGFLAAAKGVRLTVVARERSARLYAGIEAVPDLVVCSDSRRFERIGALREVLRQIRADGAVVLPPSFSAALAPFLAGVRIRAGIRSDGRGVLLNASIPGKGLREEHLSTTYIRLGRMVLEKLGIRGDHDFRAARPWVDPRDAETMRKRRWENVMMGDYVLVVPGAAYGSTKMWPWEKYRELVAALSRHFYVVIGGTAGERELCDKIGSGFDAVLNLAGRTTLGELIALVEDSFCVVANDSGAPHLAAALGVPAVVIFGSTSPVWTAPVGERVEVVREPVHCAPCFRRVCPTHLECYEKITPERVFKAVLVAVSGASEKKVSPRETH